MNGIQFYQSGVNERNNWLERETRIFESATRYETLPPETKKSAILRDILNPILPEFFQQQVNNESNVFFDAEQRAILLTEIIDEFALKAKAELRVAFKNFLKRSSTEPKNIYELAEALSLGFANNATRTLSTKLGSVWERIATLSPYAINPEIDLGLKITGIDLIMWIDQEICYAQLKTQRNTLTGSQKPRSISELEVFNKPYFCVCFDTKASWTFPEHGKITRVCGADFWSLLRFEYPLIIDVLRRLMVPVEQEYNRLIEKGQR